MESERNNQHGDKEEKAGPHTVQEVREEILQRNQEEMLPLRIRAIKQAQEVCMDKEDLTADVG